MESKPNTVPNHIGIILDGNRRFAKRLMLEPWKGHEFGFEKLKMLYKWCAEIGIKELTLYCFSIQNFDRPKMEFDFLMKVFEKACDDALTNPDIKQNDIRIKVIGRPEMFPQELQEKLHGVEEATAENETFTINLALAYGGREEIADAVKHLAQDVAVGKLKVTDITDDTLRGYLYLHSEPDMIIRTGGEQRLSNFLIWQSTYSELLFLPKTWPEFEKGDLIAAIAEYEKRERRFGK